MPGTRHPGRQPGPLANLPRPLDERDGSRRRRRVRRAAGLVVVVAATAAIGSTLANGPFGRAGDVQGAIATPEPVAVLTTVPPAAGRAGRPPERATVGARGVPAPSLAPIPLAPEMLEGYRSPLSHGRLTLPFGPSPWGSRLVEGKSFHDGIDLATFCGDRVVAAHAGRVVAAGRRFDHAMGWLGDLKPYTRRLDSRAPVADAADHGRHRRRQRLPKRLCPLQQDRRQEGPEREGRPVPRSRGCHRSRLRLPPPLRVVQPARDRDVRDRPGRREADEGAGPPDRPDRPTGRAAPARREAEVESAAVTEASPSRRDDRRGAVAGAASAPHPSARVSAADSGGRPASSSGSTPAPPTSDIDRPSRPSRASSRSVAVASAGRASTTARSIATRPGSASPSAATTSAGGSRPSYSARTSASARHVG